MPFHGVRNPMDNSEWTGLKSAQRPTRRIELRSSMLGKGCSDVVIVDLSDQGKVYAPSEFRQFYLEKQ